jgi:hypothetical protein
MKPALSAGAKIGVFVFIWIAAWSMPFVIFFPMFIVATFGIGYYTREYRLEKETRLISMGAPP